MNKEIRKKKVLRILSKQHPASHVDFLRFAVKQKFKSLPVLRGDRQTKTAVLDAGTVVPNPRVQQYDVCRVDGELERFAHAVTFWCRCHGPRFLAYYLRLPHEPRYVIQLEEEKKKKKHPREHSSMSRNNG